MEDNLSTKRSTFFQDELAKADSIDDIDILVKEIKAHIYKNPMDLDSKLTLIQCYFYVDKYYEAGKLIEQIISTFSNLPVNVHIFQAIVEYNKQNYKNTLSILHELEGNPLLTKRNKLDIYMNMLLVYNEMGHISKSFESYMKIWNLIIPHMKFDMNNMHNENIYDELKDSFSYTFIYNEIEKVKSYIVGTKWVKTKPFSELRDFIRGELKDDDRITHIAPMVEEDFDYPKEKYFRFLITTKGMSLNERLSLETELFTKITGRFKNINILVDTIKEEYANS